MARGTIVNFVLDESGSMEVCRDATIGGFNEYVETLKAGQNGGGPCLMTLTQFNTDRVHIPYAAKPVSEIAKLGSETYRPWACTPLYDAIGHSIRETDKWLGGQGKGKFGVLCVIMTDGMENSSKEYTREAISSLIKQKEGEGWTFVYLGANQDSFAASASLGMSAGNTANYSQARTKDAFAGMARASLCYASTGGRGTSAFFAQHLANADAFGFDTDHSQRQQPAKQTVPAWPVPTTAQAPQTDEEGYSWGN